MGCSGCLLKIVGIMTVVTKIIYFLYSFCNSQYLKVKFIDFDGQKIDYSIDLSGLAFLCIFKAATGVLMYKLGKELHGVFRPILKDYRDAERGITQGIQMTRRISKDMTALGDSLRRVYGMCCCLNFVMGFIFIAWACDQADNYIDVKYANMAQQNSADSFGNYKVPTIPAAPIYNDDEDMPRYADEIPSSWWQAPMLDQDGYFDLSKISLPSEQPIEYNQEQLDDTWKGVARNQTALFRHNKHHGHHGKHQMSINFGDIMKPFYAHLQEVPQAQVMDEVNTAICFVIFCAVLFGNFWLGIMMIIFWQPIKFARRAQWKLERVYMGPEIVRPTIPARANVDAIYQQEGVIQYVAAPCIDLEASSSGRVITASN